MPKYKYLTTTQFRKDVKFCIKQGRQMDALKKVVSLLLEEGKLPAEYHPHKLSGRLSGLWECHIQSDWLLIWDQNDTSLTMLMTRTGSHSEVLR
ncbi:MAG: type II toxin-antitoxin system YafQ family toxin [Bacteroidales bacterium]|nr:type II toxin-antitoxin system YafQ family toxin [Bacteroidales bacterium]